MLFAIIKRGIDDGVNINSNIAIRDIENSDFEIHIKTIVITTFLFDRDTDCLAL